MKTPQESFLIKSSASSLVELLCRVCCYSRTLELSLDEKHSNERARARERRAVTHPGAQTLCSLAMFSHGPQHKQDEINRSLVNTLLDIIAAPGWEEISSEDGVYIAKKGLAPEFEVAGQCLGDEAKFAVVMAQSVLEAPPEQVCSSAARSTGARVQRRMDFPPNTLTAGWVHAGLRLLHGQHAGQGLQ